jgi:hypothetical protein
VGPTRRDWGTGPATGDPGPNGAGANGV